MLERGCHLVYSACGVVCPFIKVFFSIVSFILLKKKKIYLSSICQIVNDKAKVALRWSVLQIYFFLFLFSPAQIACPLFFIVGCLGHVAQLGPFSLVWSSGRSNLLSFFLVFCSCWLIQQLSDQALFFNFFFSLLF